MPSIELQLANEIRPRDRALLTREQRALILQLDLFQLPILEEKLLSDGKFDSAEEYKEAFTEFKKFAFLTKTHPNTELGMISTHIDVVWHQFVLFTREYHKFCDEYLGGYLHHTPHTPTVPVSTRRQGSINFVKAYREVFGEIPHIWDPQKCHWFDDTVDADQNCGIPGQCIIACAKEAY